MMNRRDLGKALVGAAFTTYTASKSFASDLVIPRGVKERSASGRDLAIVNARIWTMDPLFPRAEAALVRNGRIVLVGGNRDIRDQAHGIRQFDASGRTIVPGFIDTHTHFELACCYYAGLEVDVHAPPLTSLQQILDRLRERKSKTTDGRWIIGRGSFSYEESITEKRFPTRLELDAISDRHPIVVVAGVHRVSMNTMAFKQLGLWDPASAAALRWRDGRLRIGTDVARDSEGRPTGSATEINDLLPTKLFTLDEKREAVRTQAMPKFVAKGLTSIATLPFQIDDIVVDQQLQSENALPLRLRCYYTVPLVVPLQSMIDVGLLPGAGDEMFRYGGVKVFPSGAGVDAAGKEMNDMKFTQEEFDDLIWRAHSAGQQVIMHEEGELSFDWGLSAVEKAQRRLPRALRHRMEHSYSVDNLEKMRRLRDAGMRITTTPMQNRYAASYSTPRYATLIREGIEPAAISDATGTVQEFSPLAAIAGLLAPRSEGGSAPPGEAPTIEDAVRMWTLWAARAQFEEMDKGSISQGKLGDFAVLSGDLEKTVGGALYDLKVDATILGGDIVYQRKG
jgi:predicted amidohydrolase YtcJ